MSEVVEVSFDDLQKIDLRTATILQAEDLVGTDKLVVLKVSLGIGGATEERQIVAGIKQHYKIEDLVGKTIVIVTNLAPRTIRGKESHGMLLAASDGLGALSLLTTDKEMPDGSCVG